MVSLVAGVLSVMAGVVILVNPRVGMAVFSLLFALWFITHCVSRLASLSLVRLVAGRGAYYAALVLNIIGIVLGALLVVLPATSLLALGYLAAVYLIVLGMESLVMAFLGL